MLRPMVEPRNQRGQGPTRTVPGAAARLRAKLQHLRGVANRRRVVAKISPSAASVPR